MVIRAGRGRGPGKRGTNSCVVVRCMPCARFVCCVPRCPCTCERHCLVYYSVCTHCHLFSKWVIVSTFLWVLCWCVCVCVKFMRRLCMCEYTNKSIMKAVGLAQAHLKTITVFWTRLVCVCLRVDVVLKVVSGVCVCLSRANFSKWYNNVGSHGKTTILAANKQLTPINNILHILQQLWHTHLPSNSHCYVMHQCTTAL